MSSNHSQENICEPTVFFTNSEIGPIIKHYKRIDLQSLMKASGKPKTTVLNQFKQLKIRNEITLIKKGKFTLYLWNEPNNPFIKDRRLLYEIHDDYCFKYLKWRFIQKVVKVLSSLHLINGSAFLLKLQQKMHQKTNELKNNDDEIDKSIADYCHKMFYKQYEKLQFPH